MNSRRGSTFSLSRGQLLAKCLQVWTACCHCHKFLQPVIVHDGPQGGFYVRRHQAEPNLKDSEEYLVHTLRQQFLKDG
jgi:hypothetical protein